MTDNFQVKNNKMLYAVGGALAGGTVGATAAYLCRENLRNSNNFFTTWSGALVLRSSNEWKTKSKKYDILEQEINRLNDKNAIDAFISSKKIGPIPDKALNLIKNGSLQDAKIYLKMCLDIDEYHDMLDVLRKIPKSRFNKVYMIIFATIGALIATPLSVLLCNKNKNKNK